MWYGWLWSGVVRCGRVLVGVVVAGPESFVVGWWCRVVCVGRSEARSGRFAADVGIMGGLATEMNMIGW